MKLPDGWTEDADHKVMRRENRYTDWIRIECEDEGLCMEVSTFTDGAHCYLRIPLAVLERAYKRVLELAAEKNTP